MSFQAISLKMSSEEMDIFDIIFQFPHSDRRSFVYTRVLC